MKNELIKKNKHKRSMISLDDVAVAQLNDLSVSMRLTKSLIIRKAIDELYYREKNNVKKSLHRF